MKCSRNRFHERALFIHRVGQMSEDDLGTGKDVKSKVCEGDILLSEVWNELLLYVEVKEILLSAQWLVWVKVKVVKIKITSNDAYWM